MNFNTDPEDVAFRLQVREFIAAHPTQRVHGDVVAINREASVQWSRLLREQGWLAPGWPVEWGGGAWSPQRQFILEEELALARCPATDAIALNLVGPLIYTYGSAEQRRRFLPTILSADEFWCQGFSEPHAGSDVASLRTVALAERDTFVVNGHKLWITNAHFADMMFALVRIRTGEEVQRGLSFLLIDMRSPGITVRPIRTIDGGHHINEVLLSDVRVPATNLVGEAGKGWVYARSVLSAERVLIAGIAPCKYALSLLRKLASTPRADGRLLMDDAAFRARLSRAAIELDTLDFTAQRLLAADASDIGNPTLAAVLKIRGAELRQRLSELVLQAAGERALIWPGSGANGREHSAAGHQGTDNDTSIALVGFLLNRAMSIAGGTTEVQRNVLAGIALEL